MLTVTADEECYVYDGGQAVLYGYDVSVAHSVSLSERCVLAVFAIDGIGHDGGILASTSTGVVTDASWKCSGVEETEWHLPGFDDSAWGQASVIAPNDGSVWASIEEISPDANWIWAQDTSTSLAYCRKTLC